MSKLKQLAEEVAKEGPAPAVDERAPMVLFAGVHAVLDPVRADPRFAGILRSVGLPRRMASTG